MSNSSLVSYTLLSPNHSGKRTHSIDRITPHCVVGQLSAASICGCFTSPDREASCNYGIGRMGRSPFVWTRETVLGVLPAMPTISGQLRLNVLPTRNTPTL